MILVVLGFSSCANTPVLAPVPVDKTTLAALLKDFETIPKTLDQATLVTAYSLVLENESATQNEVAQAVTVLKELKESIYATPMSFIDGGLEPHVRNALGYDDDVTITVGDCLGLEELDCTYQKDLGAKIRFSYDFRYFPNLKSLDLTGNSLEDLGGFAYLSRLETLSLAGNPARASTLSDDDAEADVRSLDILGKLPLKTLDLSGESVIASFSALPVMPKLEQLDISENSLESMSAIGTKFPNLKTLIATDCKIPSLSDLAFCSNLVSLDLSRTQGDDLSFLASLKTLTDLTLNGVSISDYTSLTKVPQLVSLSLSDCNITDISWIAGFTALERLNLSGNQISDPTLTAGKTSVKQLNLSGNAITSFTLTDDWSGVEELNLSKNDLTSFLISVSGECGLKVLDLSSNKVSAFAVEKASKLESVNLAGNQLETILLSSDSLRSLSLSDNPLKGLVLNLPSLASLELACNTEYTQTVSLNLPALKLLDLSEEFTSNTDFLKSLVGLETLSIHLSGISAESLSGLTSLKSLTVYGGDDQAISTVSKLSSLESLTISQSSVVTPQISGHTTLKSLNFDSCSKLADLSGISELPALESFSAVGGNLSAPALKNFPNLRTVTLSKCDLTSLSYLADLPLLTTLNLSGNGFQAIEVLGFPHLQYLDLSGNKLETLKAVTIEITKGTLDLSENEAPLYDDLSSFPDTLKVLVD